MYDGNSGQRLYLKSFYKDSLKHRWFERSRKTRVEEETQEALLLKR